MEDVDVVEPVGRRDEPLAIGAEAQVVGIDDVLHDPSALARPNVQPEQLVGDRRADQHLIAAWHHDHMVRFAADRVARQLDPAAAAQNAVGRFFRIENQNGVRPGRATAA